MSTEQTATEPEDDVTKECDKSARQWYELFRGFVYEQVPAIGSTTTGKLGAAEAEVPAAVADARDRAICTTLAAMDSIAGRFVRPGFNIDTTTFGRG